MSYSISGPSTLAAHMMRRDSVSRMQAEMDSASREIATGRRDDIYAGLGGRAAQALTLHGEAARLEGFVTSNKVLDGRLSSIESRLGAMRDAATTVMDLAVVSAASKQASARELQTAARAALEQVIGSANALHGGRALFSGVKSDGAALTGWTEPGPGGASPRDALAAIVGGGPATEADAAARLADIDDLFGDDYGAVFYQGAPGDGPRLSASVDTGERLDYGVQADDPAFRDVIKGLALLASTDVSQIEDAAAYRTWMGGAMDSLTAGIDGLLSAESRTGELRGSLEQTTQRQQDRINLLTAESQALEGVDPYEAASRLTELQSRLEASYAVTARLAQLSFLNFI